MSRRGCPFPHCECLHIGCIAGWVDDGGDRARACPTCRPEVAEHLRRAPGERARVMAGLRRLERPSRRRGGSAAKR
jgi:hypothetical protein